jgi:hypothetical protein
MIRAAKIMFPLFLAISACSGKDDAADGTGDDGGTTAPVEGLSVDIVAADGGTVEIGSASLEIPPNALTVDTTVTADSAEPDSSLPEFDSIVGLVYDFGPDGTVFDPAANLTLPLPVTPGTDETAVISWLDESANAWVDLPSTVGADGVTAPVEHFTSFVVRIVIGGGGGTPGVCEFDGGCGGDIVGSWTIDSICLYAEITDTEMPSCIQLSLDADVTGSVTFDQAGTYQSDIHFTGEFIMRASGMCLGGATDCAQLDDPEDGLTCSGDVATECVCTQPIDETDADTGSWQASGNNLMMDVNETGGEPDEGPSTSQYCVNGSQLQVLDEEGTVVSGHK